MQWLIALSVGGAGIVDMWPFGVLLSTGRLDGLLHFTLYVAFCFLIILSGISAIN